jgi:hypothetical protein
LKVPTRTRARIHQTSLVIALSIAGCLGSSNALLPGNEGAPGVKHFLVCAPNTAIELPIELRGLTAVLREQVDAYLQFQGREARWLDLLESKQLWDQAVSAAKEKGAVERAPVLFAEEVARRYAFDVIVMPSILLHETRVMDGSGQWDGVSRQMKVVNSPVRPPSGVISTLAQGIATGGVRGDVMVTSVHVLVFSRTGERIFEGRGGFGFVHDIDLSPALRGRFQYQLRDLTHDIDEIREGIAIAFDPYLPEAD